MAVDYYLVLEVQRTDTLEVIKKSYHRLAHKHHPDKGGSIEKMKELNVAWDWMQKYHSPSNSQYSHIEMDYEDIDLNSVFSRDDYNDFAAYAFYRTQAEAVTKKQEEQIASMYEEYKKKLEELAKQYNKKQWKYW